MNKQSFLLRHHQFAVEMAGASASIILYLSGIGRFRFVLAYALYSIAKGLVFRGQNQPKDLVLIPILIITIAFDIKLGPFFPIYKFNNMVLAAVLLIVIDLVARKHAEQIIDKVDLSIFLMCPSCRYCHTTLVSECNMCKYSHSNGPGYDLNKYAKFSYISEALQNKDKTIKEELPFCMRFSENVAFYKNTVRVLRNCIVVTDDSIIFLNLCKIGGWNEADQISHHEIKVMKGKMKRLFMANRPFLEIETNDEETYEIAFSSFSNYKYIICTIQDIVKNNNPNVAINNVINSMPWDSF